MSTSGPDWAAVQRRYGPVLAALFAEPPARTSDWDDARWLDWFDRVLRAIAAHNAARGGGTLG